MRHPTVAVAIFGSIAMLHGQPLPVTSVTGQPFSADEVIVENARPNVHGVVPMKTIRVYRDLAGRTRIDVSIPADHAGNPFVSIQDPVAGVHYSLDEKNKVARRLTFPSPRINPGPDVLAMNASAIHFFPGAFRGDVRTTAESLGSQFIDGFSAEGKRVTSIGAPIPGCPENSATVETWYSPELRVTLLQTHSNCMGDGSARLTNINRAEPDPYLFGVPPDYTIVEQEWSHSGNPLEPRVPPMPHFEFPRLPEPPAK